MGASNLLRVPLTPMRPENTVGMTRDDLVRWQASRSEAWRKCWPEDSRLADARDRVSRLLRRHFCWTTQAFLPDDDLDVLLSARIDDEFHEPLVIVTMEIEDLFDIELVDENMITADQVFSSAPAEERFKGKTFLNFLYYLLEKGRDDFSEIDNRALTPFALPSGYFRRNLLNTVRRRIPLFGSDKIRRRAFRDIQVGRTPLWQSRWPDDPELCRARDEVSRVLVDRLEWFNDSFVPEDRVNALFLGPRGPQFDVFQQVLGMHSRRLEPEYVRSDGPTYIDFLNKLLGRS